VEGAQDIGEHEGNVVVQGFREESGESGERIVCTDSDARDSAISEDENGSDGVDVLIDLIRNALLVELILLNAAGVS
jgi:hypothetical protein